MTKPKPDPYATLQTFDPPETATLTTKLSPATIPFPEDQSFTPSEASAALMLADPMAQRMMIDGSSPIGVSLPDPSFPRLLGQAEYGNISPHSNKTDRLGLFQAAFRRITSNLRYGTSPDGTFHTLLINTPRPTLYLCGHRISIATFLFVTSQYGRNPVYGLPLTMNPIVSIKLRPTCKFRDPSRRCISPACHTLTAESASIFLMFEDFNQEKRNQPQSPAEATHARQILEPFDPDFNPDGNPKPSLFKT